MSAIRRIDDLGRVVIPKELRYALGVGEGDALSMSLQDGKLVLTRHEVRCVYCRDIIPYDLDNNQLCSKCYGVLKAHK